MGLGAGSMGLGVRSTELGTGSRGVGALQEVGRGLQGRARALSRARLPSSYVYFVKQDHALPATDATPLDDLSRLDWEIFWISYILACMISTITEGGREKGEAGEGRGRGGGRGGEEGEGGGGGEEGARASVSADATAMALRTGGRERLKGGQTKTSGGGLVKALGQTPHQFPAPALAPSRPTSHTPSNAMRRSAIVVLSPCRRPRACALLPVPWRFLRLALMVWASILRFSERKASLRL